MISFNLLFLNIIFIRVTGIVDKLYKTYPNDIIIKLKKTCRIFILSVYTLISLRVFSNIIQEFSLKSFAI
jgi:hypothetical protein